MRVARKIAAVLLGSVLGAGVLAPPAAGARTAPPDPAEPSVVVGAVTLITGDHVSVRRVGGRLLPQVTAPPGREHVHFATTQAGDQLMVVPNDAWAALNAGRLDHRLFDVAALLRDGYGDRHGESGRDDLPLIVRAAGPSTLTATGATVTATFSTVDAVAVSQPKESVADFWTAQHGADRIWLDGLRRPSLDRSVPQIGAPHAWRAGLTGKDVPVAVLDTGVDDTHPDLRGRLGEIRNFTSEADARDIHGHGTHVAATIAGTGKASGGRFTGVAPGARLLIGKVCGGFGCPESAILAGMEWAASAGAKVVNLSLGGADTAGDDPLELAVNRLSAERGTLFVIAAGNDGGHGAETISSPASADAALSVGAVDKQDVLAGFSSRGPRIRDAAIKPEIVAPGVEITAARSRFSGLGERGDRYVAMSGTSMATPHVAGAAAILAQQHPEWSGQRLKAALMESARPLDGLGAYQQGAGRVDLARAIGQTAVAEPAAVSAGRAAWPHEDDQAVTRTVTYRNPGSAPLALALALSSVGPDGAPAPEGMFRVSSNQVTVPAGGQAEVTVTVDTSGPAEEGVFTGYLLASKGNLRLTTAVAVDREPESYDLTLRPRDGTGTPTDLEFSFVWGVDRPRFRPVPVIGGTGTLRVRKGMYHVDTTISTPRPDGLVNSSKVIHPAVQAGADTTLVLDARAAEPIAVTFDRPGVRPQAVAAGYVRLTEHSMLLTSVLGDDLDRIHIGQVGELLPRNELVAHVSGVWAVPDATGDASRAAVSYNLAWFDYGRLPTGFSRHVVDANLAQVRATYRAQAQGKRGTTVWTAREPEQGVAVGQGFPFRLPLERTEFHNVDGLKWSSELTMWTFVKRQVRTEGFLTGEVVDHAAGQSYVEDWNSAVFGPGYSGETEWASRADNTLLISVPMYSDAGLDRTGMSLVDSGSTVLYRDGTKIGETTAPGRGEFQVPAEQASYRLETRSQRSEVSEFSTKISCVWTFTSVRAPDPEPDPKGDDKPKEGSALPLMAVRFTPPNLNDRNRIRADSVVIPITVQKPSGAPEATLTGLTVDMSTNDGHSWRPAQVTFDPSGTGTVRIEHSRSDGYVSLRARAVDSAGNTVEQTVIRAYGLT